ncbi:MAG: quinoprotein dehydrogenase-associated SoxYZ-like carrier [Pseudomonadota bacterium]
MDRVQLRRSSVAALGVALALLAAPAIAGGAPDRPGETWEMIRDQLWPGQEIADGDAIIDMDAPTRAADAAIVPVEIRIAPEAGRRVEKMVLIVEENPAPVAAEFTFGEAMGPDITLSTRLRVNAYSNIRAVATLDDGSLIEVGRFVKASGGCAAPATKDAEAALAQLGRTKIREFGNDAAPKGYREAQVMVRHPQNSGFQVDQVTLLHIPAFFIDEMTVTLDDTELFRMTGGISISEDPALRFTYRDVGASAMQVTSRDTDGGLYRKSFELQTGS